MELNPYEASVTPVAISPIRQTHHADSLLRDWEHRRIWFNSVLIAVTLALGSLLGLVILQPRFWFLAVQGAVLANVCFCVGPVATWYLSRLGFEQRGTATALFWIGTAASVLLAGASLVSTFAIRS